LPETGSMRRSRFIASGTGFSTVALAGRMPAFAQASPAQVRVIFFGVAGNLPVWAGISKGFFAHENLSVTAKVTPGSVYMMQHLNAGDFDIAHTAIDNCVAYNEGQGEVPLTPPGDFVAVMGGDSGLLSAWARPEISKWTDLIGKTLAVDAITTGFAFVLERMLLLNAVGDKEYKLAPAGGTPKRYKALLDSDKYAAAILTPPFDLLAQENGLKKLGTASEWIGHYQAYAGVASRAWATQNRDVLVRYIRAYVAAIQWIYDPANKADAAALLVQNAHVTANLAPQVLAEITGPGGIDPKAKIDAEGLRNVLSLRSEFGRPQKKLTDPRKYVDETAYDLAVK
jgi:ABC-type nitrate/sulfonate/bicarbonate transport system substrate-binding protein